MRNIDCYTQNGFLSTGEGPDWGILHKSFGRWVDDELGGVDVSVQSEQRSYSRSPRAEAAALQDIGLLRAWNANAIYDGANRSGLTDRPHDYQWVG